MKKVLFVLLLVLTLCFSLGCDKQDYSLLLPSGMPLVAVGGVVDEFDTLTTDGAALLKTELMADNYDVIIAPVNLGATLYNASKLNYKMASVITMSNIYVVTRAENKLDSLSDLEGKTIYSYGDGQPADKTLKYIIEKSGVNTTVLNNGIDSVATVVQSYFVNKTAEYILCAEPYVSNIKEKLHIDINVLDLSEVAKDLGEDSLNFLPQACIYLNVNNSKEKNNAILKKIEDNINKMINHKDRYVSSLLAQDEDLYPLFNNLGEDILKMVCNPDNINYVSALDHANDIKTYLSLIGISLNDDNLFYEK